MKCKRREELGINNKLFWAKGQITRYRIEFDRYVILRLNSYDNQWYSMISMTKEEFDEDWIDVNEERKQKLLKVNNSLNK